MTLPAALKTQMSAHMNTFPARFSFSSHMCSLPSSSSRFLPSLPFLSPAHVGKYSKESTSDADDDDALEEERSAAGRRSFSLLRLVARAADSFFSSFFFQEGGRNRKAGQKNSLQSTTAIIAREKCIKLPS